MRLFIALATSVEVDEAVDLLLDGLVLGRDARRVPRDDRHVTVRFLGERDDAVAVGRAVERAAAACEPPALTLALAPERLTATAIVLPVAGAEPVAEAVARELGPPDAPFRGHLTIARARRSSARSPLAPPPGTLRGLGWTPRSLLLVASDLRGSPRYRTVTDAPWGS